MSYKVVVVVVALEGDEVIVLEVTVLLEEDNIMEVVAVDETALEVTEDDPDPDDPVEGGPGEDGQDGDGTSVGPLPFEGWKGAQ